MAESTRQASKNKAQKSKTVAPATVPAPRVGAKPVHRNLTQRFTATQFAAMRNLIPGASKALSSATSEPRRWRTEREWWAIWNRIMAEPV